MLGCGSERELGDPRVAVLTQEEKGSFASLTYTSKKTPGLCLEMNLRANDRATLLAKLQHASEVSTYSVTVRHCTEFKFSTGEGTQ